MTKSIRLFLAGLAVAILASCETTLPLNEFPELQYNHLAPIRLDAVRIELVEQYKSTAFSRSVAQRAAMVAGRCETL